MFIENNILFFDNLMVCDKKIPLDWKRKKDTNTFGFNSQRIKLINNVILYYDFMYQNDDDVVAENPDQWVMGILQEIEKQRMSYKYCCPYCIISRKNRQFS